MVMLAVEALEEASIVIVVGIVYLETLEQQLWPQQ